MITNAKSSLREKFREAASHNSGSVHIVPIRDRWAVKKEGNKTATSVKSTKSEAIIVAKSLKAVERIIIHKKDGTIQSNKKK
jgi:Uncharacterized protein conserved in bacteria (DUF2188)